jgi:hypothetical protein
MADQIKDPAARITQRILLRILRGQKVAIVSTGLAFIAAVLAIVVAFHLQRQVTEMRHAQSTVKADINSNHESGLTTRSIVCETLKSVDVPAWKQNKTCQAIPVASTDPAIRH